MDFPFCDCCGKMSKKLKLYELQKSMSETKLPDLYLCDECGEKLCKTWRTFDHKIEVERKVLEFATGKKP